MHGLIDIEAIQKLRVIKDRLYLSEKFSFDERYDLAETLDNLIADIQIADRDRQTFTFPSTQEAYDGCMTGYAHYSDRNPIRTVRSGDTIIIPAEKVVGVCDAWPFAVSKKFGVLHTLNEGWADNSDQDGIDAVRHAQAISKEKGWD